MDCPDLYIYRFNSLLIYSKKQIRIWFFSVFLTLNPYPKEFPQKDCRNQNPYRQFDSPIHIASLLLSSEFHYSTSAPVQILDFH